MRVRKSPEPVAQQADTPERWARFKDRLARPFRAAALAAATGATATFLTLSPMHAFADQKLTPVHARTVRMPDKIPSDWKQATPQNIVSGRVLLVVAASSEGVRGVAAHFPKPFYGFMREHNITICYLNIADQQQMRGKVTIVEPKPESGYWTLSIRPLPERKVRSIPVVILADDGSSIKIVEKPDFDADGKNLKNAAREAFSLSGDKETIVLPPDPCQQDANRLREQNKDLAGQVHALLDGKERLEQELKAAKKAAEPRPTGLASLLPTEQFYKGQLVQSEGANLGNRLLFSVFSESIREKFGAETSLMTNIDAGLALRLAAWQPLGFYAGAGFIASLSDTSKYMVDALMDTDARILGGKVLGAVVLDTAHVKLKAGGSFGWIWTAYDSDRKGKGPVSVQIDCKERCDRAYGEGHVELFLTRYFAAGYRISSLSSFGMDSYVAAALPLPWWTRDKMELVAEFERRELLANAGLGTEMIHSFEGTVLLPLIPFSKFGSVGIVGKVRKDWVPVPREVEAGVGGILTLGPIGLQGGYIFDLGSSETGSPFVSVLINISDVIDGRVSIPAVEDYPLRRIKGGLSVYHTDR